MKSKPEGHPADLAVVILGAGGHGLEVESYLASSVSARNLRMIGYLDSGKPQGLAWGGSRVLGDMAAMGALSGHAELGYITAVGDNGLRKRLVQQFESEAARHAEQKIEALRVVHRHAVIEPTVRLGEGSCVAPGCILSPHVEIGRHVILNVKVSVAHDSQVGAFVNLNPGVTLCGRVVIGEGAYIGAGATVIDGIQVGAWSVVGAGATVIRDVAAHTTVVGVPARPVAARIPSQH